MVIKETYIMIEVKKAVQTALEYVRSLYEPERLSDLLLEEITLSDDNLYWLVVVGFNRSANNRLALMAMENLPRAYKVVKIKTDTGEPVNMKIWRANE